MAHDMVGNTELLLGTTMLGLLLMVALFLYGRWRKGPSLGQPLQETQESNKPVTAAKKRRNVAEKRRDLKSHYQYSHQWLLTTLKGHSGRILDMDFSSNGKYLASCADDRTVLLWSVKTFELKDHKSFRANVEYDHARLVKWSPDNKAFIICKATENTVQVFRVGKKEDGSPGNIEPILTYPNKHKADIISIGISCNGWFIMTCSSDTAIIVWNLKGNVLAEIDTHHMHNYYGCVSPCGRFVASSGFTPDVKIWEVCFNKAGDFKEVTRAFELKGHSSGVNYFAFSNNSMRMASISKDGTWKLWDTNIEYTKGQEPYLLLTGSYPSGDHCILSLSPDGQTIAVSSSTDITIFSGAPDGEEVKLEEVHSDPITAMQFSPNSRYLMVAAGKHIRAFRNVPGYKNIIADLQSRKKTAATQTIKERLQNQIEDAMVVLKALEWKEDK